MQIGIQLQFLDVKLFASTSVVKIALCLAALQNMKDEVMELITDSLLIVVDFSVSTSASTIKQRHS